MVSNMIHAATESLLSPVTARLPAEPDDVRHLADTVAAERSQFVSTVQSEAWFYMREL